MKRATREAWIARVEDWKASGKSADEFAADIGVSAKSLAWWQWMLSSERSVSAKSTGRPSATRVKAMVNRSASVPPIAFVEMTAAGAVSDGIEVVFPSRVRVAVRPGFDAATLARLLEVLERRS